jgi:ribosomal protein S18 acetylase RimI-like enzyme
MEIRYAKPADRPQIAPLIYSASPPAYDFICRTGRHDAEAFIDHEFASGRGFAGWRNVTVAVKDGTVVGAGCFYDGKRLNRLILGSLFNMLLFYGPVHVWAVLKRSAQIDTLMKKPGARELYLSNFGVHPAYRGQGIGSAMIRHWVAVARNRRYMAFYLDVAQTNPRAEKLYDDLGFRVTRLKLFNGHREGFEVPNAKEMAMRL